MKLIIKTRLLSFDVSRSHLLISPENNGCLWHTTEDNTPSAIVPERTLYQHARKLQDQIKSIKTVLSADLVGHREELLEVLIDQSKLQDYNISQSELISSVTRNNQLVAAGSLDRGKGRFNVKVPGLFQTGEDVYKLKIKSKGDSVVTLRDVAEIRRTFKDRTSYSRINGKPALSIQVVKRIVENIVYNNNKVRETVQKMTAKWPASIKVDCVQSLWYIQ